MELPHQFPKTIRRNVRKTTWKIPKEITDEILMKNGKEIPKRVGKKDSNGVVEEPSVKFLKQIL